MDVVVTLPTKPIPNVTAHVPDFAAYFKLEPSWGIFHVSLADGNFEFGAADERADGTPFSELEDHLAHVFDHLTPTQRRKLGRLAEQYVAVEL